ncbi:Uncharacterised protein [Vibrio cholerae]|nr:Uncharacterised protein [Vibrio cholerae]
MNRKLLQYPIAIGATQVSNRVKIHPLCASARMMPKLMLVGFLKKRALRTDCPRKKSGKSPLVQAVKPITGGAINLVLVKPTRDGQEPLGLTKVPPQSKPSLLTH